MRDSGDDPEEIEADEEWWPRLLAVAFLCTEDEASALELQGKAKDDAALTLWLALYDHPDHEGPSMPVVRYPSDADKLLLSAGGTMNVKFVGRKSTFCRDEAAGIWKSAAESAVIPNSVFLYPDVKFGQAPDGCSQGVCLVNQHEGEYWRDVHARADDIRRLAFDRSAAAALSRDIAAWHETAKQKHLSLINAVRLLVQIRIGNELGEQVGEQVATLMGSDQWAHSGDLSAEILRDARETDQWAKTTLLTALRNGDLEASARGKGNLLGEQDWNDVEPNWRASTLGAWEGIKLPRTDVEALLIPVNSNPHVNKPVVDTAELERRYKERAANLEHSSLTDDVAFMKSLNPHMTRERVQRLRDNHAPETWKKAGRRPARPRHC